MPSGVLTLARGRALHGAAAAAVAGLLAGLAATASPGAGILVAAIALAAVGVATMSAGSWACVLAVYLPFEGVVTSHTPSAGLVWVRYGPEAVTALVALAAAAGAGQELWARIAPIRIALGALVVAWIASAVANGTAVSTSLLGFRTEMRYFPLVMLLALSDTPRRDLRWLGSAIAGSATVQAALAAAEILGGATVHHLLSQHYSVQVGGVTLTHSAAERITSVTGTLRTYNELADYLALGWTILACAGAELALSRRIRIAGLVGIPIIVVASGSREGAAFLVLAALLTARRRFRVPMLRIAAIAAGILTLSLPLWAPSSGAPSHSASLIGRVTAKWSVALRSQTWSGGYGNQNFRLYLASNELSSVISHSPLLGWGTGSIDDPRTLQNGTNPLFTFAAGRLALASNFAYDGSWSLLLMQTGLLGLALALALIASVARMGVSLLESHWIGDVLILGTVGVAVVGLFAPVLEQHSFSAGYWALVGGGLALRGALAPR